MSPDHELAEHFRDGDEHALRIAYDRFGGAVLHLAQRVLGNRSDAEDVTQATFVAAWQGGRRSIRIAAAC
jgi:DNA-directed RNA polymerase specialized sigma24 family protein